MKRGLLAGFAAVIACALPASASATYHENLIREVHEGSGGNGDYVVLQAYNAGQNAVNGKFVNTYDGGGAFQSSAAITSDVGNGASQATILVAHDASTVPAPDVIDATFNVVNTGGTVCFSAVDAAVTPNAPAVDCVAYDGDLDTMFPTGVSPYGTPVDLSTGSLDGLANNASILRTIGRGCATLLDLPDDSNNSNADFALGTPNPRNNASPITETPCPTPTPGLGNPTSNINPAGNVRKRKCKKKKRSSARTAKKKCKKKK